MVGKKFHWTNVLGNRFAGSMFERIVEDLNSSAQPTEQANDQLERASKTLRVKLDVGVLTNFFFKRKEEAETSTEVKESKKKTVAQCLSMQRSQKYRDLPERLWHQHIPCEELRFKLGWKGNRCSSLRDRFALTRTWFSHWFMNCSCKQRCLLSQQRFVPLRLTIWEKSSKFFLKERNCKSSWSSRKITIQRCCLGVVQKNSFCSCWRFRTSRSEQNAVWPRAGLTLSAMKSSEILSCCTDVCPMWSIRLGCQTSLHWWCRWVITWIMAQTKGSNVDSP